MFCSLLCALALCGQIERISGGQGSPDIGHGFKTSLGERHCVPGLEQTWMFNLPG